jgi:hypothetical protein
VIPFTGGDELDFTLTFWELWQKGALLLAGDGNKPFVETPEKGTSNSSYDVKWQHYSDTYEFAGLPGCYREARLTIPVGIGKRPIYRARTWNESSAELIVEGHAVISTKNPSCSAVRLATGYIDVRRSKGKWVSRKVSDVCTLKPVKRKSVTFGKGLTVDFYKGGADGDDNMRWDPTITVGLRGPSRESIAFRARGGGVTFTQKLAIQRIDGPDRKIWAGTDEYWNYCVNHAKKVYAENGNYYCWKYGVDTIRVRKA